MATVQENALLVLVRCYKARSDREQYLWRYRCLKAALSSGVTSLQVVVSSARSVSRGSNEAVSLLYLVSSPSSPTCRVKTQDLKRYVSHHWPVSPVTQQLGLWFLYCFSHLWALLLLTYVVASRIWSCHELDCMEYLPLTGFCYSKLLTYLCHDYSRFINNSGINLNGSVLWQVSSFYPN